MKKCVIVDDTELNRKVAAQIVKDLGFEVMEYESAAKAFFNLDNVDVVLLDWHMPDITGIEISALIKEQKKLQEDLKKRLRRREKEEREREFHM